MNDGRISQFRAALMGCMLTVSALGAAVVGEDAASGGASRTVVSVGAYRVGELHFDTAGGQPVKLLIAFRNGQPVDSLMDLDGRRYSPVSKGQYGMNPVASDHRVAELRFDGERLSGEFKWRLPKGQGIESVAIGATVKDGVVEGTAGGAKVSGHLFDEARMAREQGFGPGKDWTMWTGSKGDWTGADTDRELVADPKDRRLVWFSEIDFGGGRDGRRDPIRYISGYTSPILGDGKIFMVHQEPVGEVVDKGIAESFEKGMRYVTGDLDPVAVLARQRGSEYMARVEAEDVVFGIDAASGATLWKTTLPAPSFMPAPYNKHADDNRTGCYADGKVFVLGRTAVLYALDGASGKLLWRTPVPKFHAAWEKKRQAAIAARKLTPMGGLSNATYYPPLVHADGVVFGVFPGDGLVAFDAANGKLLWSSAGTPWQPFGAARWDHDGHSYIVFTGPKGLTCAEPRTGKVVWEKPVSGSPVGSLELRLLGSHLICKGTTRVKGADGKWTDRPQETYCYLLEKDGPRHLWTMTDEDGYKMRTKHAISARNGVAYLRYDAGGSGTTKQKLLAVDLGSGEILARRDFWGTFIGMIEVSSGWVLVHEDGCHQGSTFTVYTERDLKRVGTFEPTHVTTSSYDSPMAYPFVDGRLIMRGRNRLYCYDLRKSTLQTQKEIKE